MRGWLGLSISLLFATDYSAAGQPASPDITFSLSQEAVLLTANKITAAAERCNFKINDAGLSSLLHDAGVEPRDMEVKKQSKSLSDGVASYIKSFKDHKQVVCSEALKEFGKDAGQGTFLSR